MGFKLFVSSRALVLKLHKRFEGLRAMNPPLGLAQRRGCAGASPLKSRWQGQRLRPVSWHGGDRTGVATFASSCLWVLGTAARAAQDPLLTGPAKLPGGAGVGAAGRGRWDGWMDGL